MRLIALSAVAALVAFSSTGATAGGPSYPACKERSAMARVLELADQSDYQAARLLIQRGMKSKDCQMIPADQLVIETTPPLSRVVKVHKRGDPDEYWILQ
ncbi:hypothetical protein [Methylocystis echinoides]|uniref:hypothetical protein n=1 Tax=Methylocystis echinoides TaxID=29468 RepID=UPI00342F3FAE